jgi:hypothetical protein
MTEDARALTARLIAQSPSAMLRADALAHIKERRNKLLAPAGASKPTKPSEPGLPPPPDIADPTRYADDFWKARQPTRSAAPKKLKPAKPRGRRPVGDRLDERHDKFTVIDCSPGDSTK